MRECCKREQKRVERMGKKGGGVMLALVGWRKGGSTIFSLQTSLWGLTEEKRSRRLAHRREWGKEGGAQAADRHVQVLMLIY